MEEQRGPLGTRGATKGVCQHEWIISQFDGPTGRGYCRHCKEVGIFVRGHDWPFDDSHEAVESVLPSLLRLVL